MALLHFAPSLRARLDRYLPPRQGPSPAARPWVTLTYATSLDSQIAAAPGTQTVLSGPASKAMTHYLRTRHDAILVGAGTACADNPTLTSRLDDAASLACQPRPVVLDRRARWRPEPASKVVQAAASGAGKGPWVVVGPRADIPAECRAAVEGCGGAYVALDTPDVDLPGELALLRARGVGSVMIEGGAEIINAMLAKYQHLVDALIVTIAPVYLGQGGVQIVPLKANAAAPAAVRLADPTWIPLDNDIVLCGKVDQSPPS